MKNIFLFVALSVSLAAFAQGKEPGRHFPVSKTQQNLDLKIHINGLTGGEVLLAHYYANQNRITDTGKVDAGGNVHFKKDTFNPGGIYLVVLPSKRHFELVLAEEQKFTVDIKDTNDIISSITIKGSKENIAYYEYQRFLNDQGKKSEPWREAQKRLQGDDKKKDSLKLVNKKLSEVDSIVKQYKRDYYQKLYPQTFMAKVLRAMDEPDQIPLEKCPKKPNGTIDSLYGYWNYRNHYWDGFDFTDERLLRTPVYYNKMKFWIEKVVPQHPDSLMISVDWLIDKTSQSDELYKYTVSFLTYQYESSKIMGYDAVFVHIVMNNHALGKCWWLDEERNTKIVNRAKQLNYCLINKQAVNLTLQDSSGKVRELGKVQAKYTLITFWDPTCSHCKTEIPAVKTYYDSLRAAGVSFEVYAIYSELDYPTWKAYIKSHKHTWMDVCAKDQTELAYAKYYYDVYSTPTMYLLDQNKKIIAKRFDDKGLKQILNRKIEEDKKR